MNTGDEKNKKEKDIKIHKDEKDNLKDNKKKTEKIFPFGKYIGELKNNQRDGKE